MSVAAAAASVIGGGGCGGGPGGPLPFSALTLYESTLLNAGMLLDGMSMDELLGALRVTANLHLQLVGAMQPRASELQRRLATVEAVVAAGNGYEEDQQDGEDQELGDDAEEQDPSLALDGDRPVDDSEEADSKSAGSPPPRKRMSTEATASASAAAYHDESPPPMSPRPHEQLMCADKLADRATPSPPSSSPPPSLLAAAATQQPPPSIKPEAMDQGEPEAAAAGMDEDDQEPSMAFAAAGSALLHGNSFAAGVGSSVGVAGGSCGGEQRERVSVGGTSHLRVRECSRQPSCYC